MRKPGRNKESDGFERISLKTADQIKMSCEKVQSQKKTRYHIDHNGNHIWLKINLKNTDYWAPMLHVEMQETNNNITFIKGKFGKNPFLWLLFLGLRVASAGIFIITAIVSYFKWMSGELFNSGLLIMFLMVNVWFAQHFISEWNNKKAVGQKTELNDLMEDIAG